MKKCVMILNPTSGIKKKIDLQNFYDVLRKHGYDTELKYTRAAKDATKIVANLPDDVDLVISAGGDGTLHEVVAGNMQRKKKLVLGNIPMGTVNDVGSMLGYTNNFASNLNLLLNGQVKNIDVCKINGEPFVYVACLGDYIDIAYNTPQDLKKRFGKIAYGFYAIKQFANKIHSYNIKYKVNGKTYAGEYSFFFITNSSHVANVDDIYYDVKLDDNMFEVALANVKTKADMVRMLFLVNNQDAKTIPEVTYFQTDRIAIEFIDPPKSSWCIDGEEYKSPKMEFTFTTGVDDYTPMLIPKEKTNKLFK
jgi:diacylglycerol kinase (ATP)